MDRWMIDTYAINFIYKEKRREKKAFGSCFFGLPKEREREQLLSRFSSPSAVSHGKVRAYELLFVYSSLYRS